MSVLIKGMEMPSVCFECHLSYDCMSCIATGTKFWNRDDAFDPDTARLPDCPLVELPPHGDLIDREALAFEDDIYGWRDKKIVKAAPVVIPAEREGE